MGMHVDKAGAEYPIADVDRCRRLIGDGFPHKGDPVAGDPHIRPEPGRPCAVDDAAVLQNDIEQTKHLFHVDLSYGRTGYRRTSPRYRQIFH